MTTKEIIFACLLAISCAENLYLGFNLIDSQLIGGSNADEYEYPHQITLQWGETASKVKHICGGTILNSEWVLTAGHCIQAIPTSGELVVKAGKRRLDKLENTEQTLKVLKRFYHPNYPGSVAPYDIGLVKLAAPLKMNRAVMPINLPQQDEVPCDPMIVTGWGAEYDNGTYKIMPNILQKAIVSPLDYETCNDAVKDSIGYSPLSKELNLCTGPLTGAIGVCIGDSGGPLILRLRDKKLYLMGLVSWTILPCGNIDGPSVYTKVFPHIGWINKTVLNN